ncbi:MAG: hypothetical protein ABI635_07535, partial [Actinomycetota bacterium]
MNSTIEGMYRSPTPPMRLTTAVTAVRRADAISAERPGLQMASRPPANAGTRITKAPRLSIAMIRTTRTPVRKRESPAAIRATRFRRRIDSSVGAYSLRAEPVRASGRIGHRSQGFPTGTGGHRH